MAATGAAPHAVDELSGIWVDPAAERKAKRQAIAAFLQRMRSASPDARKEALNALDPDFKKEVALFLIEVSEGRVEGSGEQLKRAITTAGTSWRPRTDDELDRFVQWAFGFRIPRRAVCEGHVAPFEMLADIFFERGNPDKAGIGNRGSGKTLIMAIAHTCNSLFKVKYQSVTVGAQQAQAARCYGHVKAFTTAKFLSLVNKKPLMSSTSFKNGASIGVLTGTISGVNSPHPHHSHLDEFELYRKGVFQEAMNMAQASQGYRASNTLTSSWKFPSGPVTLEVINPDLEAKKAGRPHGPWQVYIWCIWETTSKCEADCSACPYADVIKGDWGDGDPETGKPSTPRSFESVCKQGSPEEGIGKLKFSDGFNPIEDTLGKFTRLSRRMWEAQQESRRPTSEGLVYPEFDEQDHTVDWWEPDPEYGAIDFHVDFGGTNPFAIGFWQTLDVDVILNNDDGSTTRVREGTEVMFDEIYVGDGIGNVAVAKLFLERIEEWEMKFPGFKDRCGKVWRDPAARAAASDWRNLSHHGGSRDIVTSKPRGTGGQGRSLVELGIALNRELFREGRYRIDRMRCESMMMELGSYEQSPTTGKPVKENDHHMDGFRYRAWGRHKGEGTQTESAPVRTRPANRAVRNADGQRTLETGAMDGVTKIETRRARIVRSAPRTTSLGGRRV